MLVSTGAIVSLDGTGWLLQSYIDLKGNALDVLPGTEIDITFQNARVVGVAGCNSYITKYELQSDQIGFDLFEVTEKYCTAPRASWTRKTSTSRPSARSSASSSSMGACSFWIRAGRPCSPTRPWKNKHVED